MIWYLLWLGTVSFGMALTCKVCYGQYLVLSAQKAASQPLVSSGGTLVSRGNWSKFVASLQLWKLREKDNTISQKLACFPI